jgi:hypothetical protein
MAKMTCEICDEEFDTEEKLAQHKATMHAGMQAKQPMQGEDGGMSDDMDEGEEPDFKRAANE